jgi:hypothetical protein
MAAIVPDWMSKSDQHMMDIEVEQPIPWQHFCDRVRLSNDRVLAVIEHSQKREPSIATVESDVIVGSALVVWPDHHIGVLKTH